MLVHKNLAPSSFFSALKNRKRHEDDWQRPVFLLDFDLQTEVE